MHSNGLNVGTGANYSGLFTMLTRGHIHHFPQAVSEIQLDVRMHPDMNLDIEPGLLLYYPLGMYFMVNRAHAPLTDALERGQSLADGRLQALFVQPCAKVLADRISASICGGYCRSTTRSYQTHRAQHPGYWLRTPGAAR